MTDKLDRLINTLHKELKLTGTQMAEILWLAMQGDSNSSSQTKTALSEEETTQANQTGDTTKSSETSSTKPQHNVPSSVSKESPDPKLYPKTAFNSSNQGGLPIKVPDASSLPNSRELAKALRPLKQYNASGKAVLLDEEATIKRIAELQGIITPILKRRQELQFDLVLVVDLSDSMIFWERTTQELQHLLKHYGIFRNVQTWGMIKGDPPKDKKSKKGKTIYLRQGIKRKNYSGYRHSPKKIIDLSGRRLILVVSDCVSEVWRNGEAFSLLQDWGKHNVVAIAQMLPERMWLRTALSLGAMVQLDSSQPNAPNHNLFIKEVLLWNDVGLEERDSKKRIKLPVFSLEPELVETWSEMVVNKGRIGAGGFVFNELSQQQPTSFENTNEKKLTSEERVYNFEMSSSQIALYLAKLLAAAPVINLPIVRLIQKNFKFENNFSIQQYHVAEVFLGGILKPQTLIEPETNPDEVQYRFINEEIRDILLKDSLRTNAYEIITIISKDIAQRLKETLKNFYALLKKPDELEEKLKQQKLKQGNNLEDFDVKHFATVTTKVLKRLGGPYARFASEIEESNNLNKETNSQPEKSIEDFMRISLQSFGFNHKEIETTPNTKQELQAFEFETVTVNARGKEINREQKQAYYFVESLGEELGIEMISIPGGTFEMGSPEDEPKRRESESPQHTVTVQPFFMGKYLVTQAQWRFVAQLDQIERELEINPSRFEGDNLPVEKVSWYDVEEFYKRLSKYTGREYRLPSEAEWEYACRAGTTTPFHLGETITSELVNYNSSKTFAGEPKEKYRGETTPVGQFPANAFGLHDMHGNVWEWCLDDWHGNYEGAPTVGTAWLDNDNDNRYHYHRVLRGGSWFSDPENCRSACRDGSIDPGFRNDNLGFRVVCAVAQRILQ